MNEPSAATPSEGALYVLTLDVVRAGIKALQGQRIHEHFPGYIYLRQRAMQAGSLTAVEADWGDVGALLRVDGGPSNKPHFRPFSSRNLRDPSGYWYARNLPGSYAVKSIRSGSPMASMLDAAGSGYELPVDHAQQALAQMLGGTRVPAWALAVFYVRDYGFALDPPGTHDDLIDAFKKEYLFDQGDDFDVLFDATEPLSPQGPWFEPYVAAEQNNDPGEEQASDIDG